MGENNHWLPNANDSGFVELWRASRACYRRIHCSLASFRRICNAEKESGRYGHFRKVKKNMYFCLIFTLSSVQFIDKFLKKSYYMYLVMKNNFPFCILHVHYGKMNKCGYP